MRRTTLLALSTLPSLACGQAKRPEGPAQASPQPRSTPNVVSVQTVARDLEHPWGLAFLPDGRMLVTERPGRLRLVSKDGKVTPEPLKGVPRVVAQAQGGLLGIALDPAFAKNRYVYLVFSEPGDPPHDLGKNGTAAARGVLNAEATGLDSVTIIYHQLPKIASGAHFGGRILFAPDTTIFITQGERFTQRNQAQDLASGLGKVVHINRDGSIPANNPYKGQPGKFEPIWSYGHRNMQGAAIDPETGRLWTIEHGPMGGDELNHPEPGKNYGWPVISYGLNYEGTRIGSGAVKDGMEQPVYYWDPVIAPSGMTFYTGTRYPGWKGNIFVGSMTPGALVRLEMSNGRVVKEERYLGELGERIRDVVQGPDGYLYLLTDNSDGRILKVVPAPAGPR
jgi:glucose/arabinose dehydrogenase